MEHILITGDKYLIETVTPGYSGMQFVETEDCAPPEEKGGRFNVEENNDNSGTSVPLWAIALICISGILIAALVCYVVHLNRKVSVLSKQVPEVNLELQARESMHTPNPVLVSVNSETKVVEDE